MLDKLQPKITWSTQKPGDGDDLVKKHVQTFFEHQERYANEFSHPVIRMLDVDVCKHEPRTDKPGPQGTMRVLSKPENATKSDGWILVKLFTVGSRSFDCWIRNGDVGPATLQGVVEKGPYPFRVRSFLPACPAPQGDSAFLR